MYHCIDGYVCDNIVYPDILHPRTTKLFRPEDGHSACPSNNIDNVDVIVRASVSPISTDSTVGMKRRSYSSIDGSVDFRILVSLFLAFRAAAFTELNILW